MTNAQREKRIEKAQLQVLFRAPFFASGVARLPVIFEDNNPLNPTACTDGRVIRWNGPWFDTLPDPTLVTVLCHEVCHPMLGHLWRAPTGADHDLWNQACDHAVNLMLKEFSALRIAANLADPFPFPEPQSAYCADPQYADMSEELIYSKLPKGGTGTQSKRGLPLFGEFIVQDAASEVSSSETKKLKNDWDATFLQACELAKAYGSLPGGLERYLTGLISPVVSWREVLQSWLREQCADDWNWLEPALEYEQSGFILPSMKSDRMGAVVFGSDWSGSTWGDLVEKFHAEKQGCLDQLRPGKLVDVAFDTRVISAREYFPGDLIDPQIKGGGGTDFRPVIEHCNQMQPAPKCVVILTDLDGAFPDDPPPYPVLWVTWSKGAKAPFGQVIYAE